MKKYIFALIAVGAISLTSCKQNSSTETTEVATDSTSISVDSECCQDSTGTTVDTTEVKADELK